MAPLTPEEKRQASAAKRRGLQPEDLKEIPPIPRDHVRRVTRTGAPFAPPKRMLTVRLDADVFDWLRGLGKGYQTKLNALLRAAKEVAEKR